ncbi:MAG: SIMPL domain-containing protein [Solirubrobacteraceae bacterium]
MRRTLWALLLAGWSSATLAGAPAAAAQAGSITATGTSQSVVHPRDRNSNASIVTAFDAARQAAIGGALRQAHEYALDYARAVGLKLGSVLSVSDAQNNVFYGPGQFIGPFGPNQFCGTLRQPIFKKGKNGRRRVVGTKKVHRCIVPRFAFVTLTVTYSAS